MFHLVKEHGRRVKKALLPVRHVLVELYQLTDVEGTPETVQLMRPRDLPAGCRIVACSHDPERLCFVVYLEHDSFPEVPETGEVPELCEPDEFVKWELFQVTAFGKK